jgi:cytochrome P450
LLSFVDCVATNRERRRSRSLTDNGVLAIGDSERRLRMDKAQLPPGPKQPAALQGAWLTYRPFRFLEWCRDHHGETFTVKIPSLGSVPIFTRPEEIERIFDLDGSLLSGGAAQAPLVDFAGDRSLMKLDGSAHRAHREILGKALRPSELPDGGEATLDRIRQAVSAWPVGRRFNVGEAVDQLALLLVSDLALVAASEELLAAASKTLDGLSRAARPMGLFRKALARGSRSQFQMLRRVAEPYLESKLERGDARSHAPSTCIFGRMAAARSQRGRQLDGDDVRDEMMTVLVAMMAGFSCGLKHAFYWILRSPGTQARLSTSADGSAAFPPAVEIARRPFLDAVCKEVLRFCPDIPFAVRKTSTAVEIGGWHLPEGTTLGIGIYLTHRRASSFEDPDRFWPERLLSARPSRFEYLPFGGGRRGCVAGPLYLFVQKMILAAVFERFRLNLCDRRSNPVTLMAIVSSPARPLSVIAERA